ncbi:acetyltransferase [Actinoplanes cyaneus]|uniref:Acetyltransferase n=1 Tax=Actinoplanes cyaneus TaxID=52696 RepID=A0A919MCL4_9ACTN|nr:GNAT family N-acetyltransferase [Actinoplanes cyaneus]MCW2138304.1 Protein N-acetyltransferase, RimJ/RimL family [Actinoplanes cyaneus]GID66261.1 acetyltransferase [Actinoplanes cyaneus]
MPSLVAPALPAGKLSASAQPSIPGDGLLLRPWQESDRAAVVTGYADPAIQRWHCHTMTDDEAAAWIAVWSRHWHEETGASWAIMDGVMAGRTSLEQDGTVTGQAGLRQDGAVTGQAGLRQVGVGDGTVAGQVGLRRVDLGEGLAAISYWVLPEFRGRRIAPRALAALTSWAFGQLGLHRLELSHSTANQASCRVAEQAGYRVEGVKRSEARHADGWHDMHLHARLATD